MLLTLCPLAFQFKEGRKKSRSQAFLNNEIRGGIFLYNLKINQLFQTLVLLQIFGKDFSTISLRQTDPKPEAEALHLGCGSSPRSASAKQYKQNGRIPEVHSGLCQNLRLRFSQKQIAAENC